jgi:hypothetical protein
VWCHSTDPSSQRAEFTGELEAQLAVREREPTEAELHALV